MLPPQQAAYRHLFAHLMDKHWQYLDIMTCEWVDHVCPLTGELLVSLPNFNVIMK